MISDNPYSYIKKQNKYMYVPYYVLFTEKEVTFTNWEDGQPGIASWAEDCCLMEFRKTGYWHDYFCDGFLFFPENHGWICEYGLIV